MCENKYGRCFLPYAPLFQPNAFASICFYLHFKQKERSSHGKSPNSRSKAGGDNSGVSSAERPYASHSSAFETAGKMPPAAQYFARSLQQYAAKICADVCNLLRHSANCSARRNDSAAPGTRTFWSSFFCGSPAQAAHSSTLRT
mgnify:CR=1 FL=1